MGHDTRQRRLSPEDKKRVHLDGRYLPAKQLEPVRGFMDDLEPMTTYWRHRRERREKLAKAVASSLQALPRPLKPPQRKAAP